MSLVLQSSGGGSVTLEEPVTASNFTITVPAVTGTMATVDGSGNASVTGNLSFNSGYGSSAVGYGSRAWVFFNGTGTVAIIGSGNVSSVSDNGVGSYTVNFTTAMPDAFYAATGQASFSSSFLTGQFGLLSRSVGSIDVFSATPSGTALDVNRFDVVITR
tara:strand:- start:3008 stop:3487 length:480 start_codon:yes stop_codon:yes gene_type:complete